MLSRLACVVFVLSAINASSVFAEGESINGFPNWNERVLLEWTNRARSDPQVEMTACGANCGDAACYSPIAPLRWSENLAHSARFHADNMEKLGFLSATSQCQLVANIASLYPGSCDASAACACVGGTATCSGNCTTFSNRIALFGASASGENNAGAGAGDPNSAFFLWLFEHYPISMQPPNCRFAIETDGTTNGHRWQILKNTGTSGGGLKPAGTRAVVDFSSGGGSSFKIPSAAHYPRQAASVDAWASWFDAAGPGVAKIDVDGVCSDMTLARGVATNGAWHATINGVGSGCHRYFFAFKDSNGGEVVYPTTGSLTIGDGSASCPDFSSASPAGCAGFDRIFASGFDS